ncbi:MAG: trigger factor [Bacteroidota bacterium]
MDISIQELTSVDKELTLKATREDLQPEFDKAFKKYKTQIALPGFRPGRVPIGLVKKRFGKEIELEEINKYIQKVFETDVIPEYNPIGETEMLDLQWENDELEATFKIGSTPQFEVADLKSLTVNKMVHDVTDADVEEELERTLEREGNWEEVDANITKEHKLKVDVVSLDEKGEELEGEKDVDQDIDLRQDAAKEFLAALDGKKKGDVVDMEVGEEEEKDRFRVTVKSVHQLHKAELTEELIKAQSNGEAATEDELKSYLKSRMQQYYDQTTEDLFKSEVVDVLVNAHEMEIPEVFLAQVQNGQVEQMKQQYGGQLPETFDEEAYKEQMKERAQREAQWFFISQKLQEIFEDIEIKPEDIDGFISAEAARYGVAVDQLKQYYASNPSMLEQLRGSIRENKVFEKLQDEVSISELDKDAYRELQEKKAQ